MQVAGTVLRSDKSRPGLEYIGCKGLAGSELTNSPIGVPGRKMIGSASTSVAEEFDLEKCL